MPGPYYSPWTDFGNSFGQAGSDIAGITSGLARLRFQQGLAAQQMALKQQQFYQKAELDTEHAALYAAQKALEDAKMKQLGNEDWAGSVLGNAIEQLVNPPSFATPDQTKTWEGIAANQMGRLAAQGRHFVPENYAQIRQEQNPVMQAIIAAGGANKLAFNTPQGGITTPTIPGLPTVVAPYTLPQGAERFPPQIFPSGGPALNLNQPQQPIATGLPKLGVDTTQKEVGTLQSLLGHLMSFGEPNNPNDPIYQAATNALLPRLQQMGKPKTPPPASLKVGEVYDTPKGRLKWTGTGFVQP